MKHILISLKYWEYSALKFILLSVLCWLTCSCASQEYYKQEGYIDHSLCVNAHLGYSGYDFEYRKEVSKALGDLKAGMVRDYIFVNSSDFFADTLLNAKMDPRSNRAYVIDNVLYHLQKNAPGIQVLGVLHDMKWEIDKNVPFTRFYELVKKAVKRYDGKSRFTPTDSKEEMSYEIKYWEICNEFDMHIYGKYPFETAKKTFELLKNSYLAIKTANPDAVVVFPGIANTKSSFVNDMLEFQDADGKRIWDYFDVFNFHVYPQMAEDLPYYIGIIKNYQKKYGWDKPIWLTEVGWSELLKSEDEVAALLPKMYLTALACGVERVFQFQFRRFDYSLGTDASFGLIRSSLDGTYISLKSGGEPLSLGTAYNHILIRDSLYSFTPSKYYHKDVGKSIFNKLRRSGLSIQGNDYIINKVAIIHNNRETIIFNKEESKDINLSASLFSELTFDDKISISFKQYKKKLGWKNADKTLSYYSMKQLINLLPDGSTIPTLKVQNGVYEAKWAVREKKYTAIWCKNERDLSLNGTGKIKIQNYLGKKMKSSSSKVKINNKVLYFEGDYNYILQ